MNFCKDCKHIARQLLNGSLEYAQCRQTLTEGVDPVTGEGITKMTFCSTRRSEYGDCGPSGKFFEPATVEQAA